MKRKYKVLIIVSIIVVLFVVAGIIVAKSASRMIEAKKQNILGLALEIKAYHIDWLRARIVMEDVALYPTGKVKDDEKLASVKKLIFALSPLDIFGKKELHATEIIFEKPEFSYIQLNKKQKNWDALDTSQLGGEKNLPPPSPPYKRGEKDKDAEDGFKVRVDELTVRNGSVSYRDRTSGKRLDLKDLNVEIKNLAYEQDITKLPTKIAISASIDDTSGRLKLDGNANLLAKGINFKLTASLSPMSLTYFSPFYAGSIPFQISAGTISMGSHATSSDSELKSNHHIAISGLKAGGGTKGDLINQFVLSKKNDLAFDVAVNGNLETGEVSISNTASKVIAAQLEEEAMKESVKQLPIPIPGKNLMKNLFGH